MLYIENFDSVFEWKNHTIIGSMKPNTRGNVDLSSIVGGICQQGCPTMLVLQLDLCACPPIATPKILENKEMRSSLK